MTVGEIAASMALACDVELEDAERDVANLIARLAALHLLESGEALS